MRREFDWVRALTDDAAAVAGQGNEPDAGNVSDGHRRRGRLHGAVDDERAPPRDERAAISAPGNQVGEKRLAELLTEAGFSHVRRAAVQPHPGGAAMTSDAVARFRISLNLLGSPLLDPRSGSRCPMGTITSQRPSPSSSRW